jgi:hypothetical protein
MHVSVDRQISGSRLFNGELEEHERLAKKGAGANPGTFRPFLILLIYAPLQLLQCGSWEPAYLEESLAWILKACCELLANACNFP